MKPVSVEPAPNHFQLSIEGPDPAFAVGGTHDQQELQRDVTALLTAGATASYGRRGLPSFLRMPPDRAVSARLDKLNPNPPIGTDGAEVPHAVYTSQIPNATRDPGYAGQGIKFDPLGQVVAMGGESVGNVRADPGGAVDAGIDVGGDLVNLGLGLDTLGKTQGGFASGALDRVGDAAKAVIDFRLF